MLEYQLVRSQRRKTLSLQVKQGKVFVRAPHYVDSKVINALVQNKSAWLKAKIFEQSQQSMPVCQFNTGDKLYYLGQPVSLMITFASTAKTEVLEPLDHDGIIKVSLANRFESKYVDQTLKQIAVKKQLERYFKQQLQPMIDVKVTHFSEITQLFPSDITIRQYSARWGSCNSKNQLSFNYLMMMLPEWVIDYIVVHELCHLKYLNHSTQFWQLVSQHFPKYQLAKQWLKSHQSQLLWQLPL